MNKDKFLKELEKRLSILNEKERKDIIDEYRSTIEEKIKNGEEEESAVKDFGNIDDLVKEILEAYKINPKYKGNDFQKFINDGENLIKECADTLAKGVKDAAESFKNNNQEINLSLVFEIMIKVFLTIIFIGLLKIPFMIFTHIGNSFFEVLFSPLDVLIKVLWTLFLSVIYLVAVVLVIVKIFKEYFIKKDNKDSKEKNNKEEKITNETKIRENKKEISKKKQISSSQISSILLTVTKILAIFFFLIPLICTNIGLISATVISIYYWIKGIDLFGLTMLLTGISMISIWLTHLTASILEEKHVKAYLLIIGIILTIIGGVIFGLTLTKIEYIDETPKQTELETMTNTYNTDKKVYIETHNEEDVSKKIDETLEDNTFKIKIKYPVKLYNIKIEQTDNYTFNEETCKEDSLCGTYNYFEINYNEEETKNIKTAYNLFIENLKDNKIYNYEKAYRPTIEIYSNEKTMNIIEID
ncbi:MAG: DUF1700 domain-containing protein [Bacilli bacterium]|nr:DUF1700 domain-containing protein [Bacilli bacterium]